MTDPRFTDPRLSDPMIRRDEWTSGRDENVGGMWSWVAGVSMLLLIGFLIFAGWNNNSNTANRETYHDGLSHRDTAEQHHRHGLVIAADDHPTPAPSKSGTQ